MVVQMACAEDEVEVRPLRGGDDASYASFVENHEAGLLYYSLSYKALLEEVLGCDARYWIADGGGGIEGVLPVMERDGPYGRVINALPFYGSHGGVLASTDRARLRLVKHYESLVKEPGVAAAAMIENPLAPLETPPAHDMQDDRIGQMSLFQVDDASNGLRLRQFDGDVRYDIRKAERDGVTVTIDNGAMDFVEATHRENMAAIGGRAKSAVFFQAVPRHFAAGRDYNIYVAERKGNRIAALLVFYFARTAEYFTPATLADARPFQPMALILWTAMQDAVARGVMRWNWGGTWRSQTGVNRFKKKWGAEESVYRYFVTLNNAEILNRSPSELLDAYPDFFVVPFERLKATG